MAKVEIEDEKYIRRCIELARNAFGKTYPNPMVGCVIVHNGRIIGEGYHHKAGEPHAEVNAIASVRDHNLLPESTLYVSLEPCAHYGKTPPCADLIVSKHLQRVVVACGDSFSKVAGKGIERIRAAGIPVTVPVLEQDARFLNRRFFTYHEKKRPYIILKWAQTADAFIDKDKRDKSSLKGVRITDSHCEKLVHQWRSEEQAILVGRVTACDDNPSLTTRLVPGDSPLRLAWDLHDSITGSAQIKNHQVPTIVYTLSNKQSSLNLEYVSVQSEENLLRTTLEDLYNRQIQSLIVEGGSCTLQTFISSGIWDEARVFTTAETFGRGISAPVLQSLPRNTTKIGNARLDYYYNTCFH